MYGPDHWTKHKRKENGERERLSLSFQKESS